jgi:NAD(P)-dependent dehydrogenase (short-subunit alcohol dehydrogenase family)
MFGSTCPPLPKAGGNRGISVSAAEHSAKKGLGVILTCTNLQTAALVVDRIEEVGGKAAAPKLNVSLTWAKSKYSPQ